MDPFVRNIMAILDAEREAIAVDSLWGLPIRRVAIAPWPVTAIVGDGRSSFSQGQWTWRHRHRIVVHPRRRP